MIKLRHLQETDLEKVMKWRTSERVTKYMFTDVDYNIVKQKEWFDTISKDPATQVWVIEYKQKCVGMAYLTDINSIHRWCFKGYYIAEECALGNGLAKHLECNIYDYVFSALKLNKIYSDVFIFNERAIHIYKKYGSEIEGIFKQHIFKNGKFNDVARMAILYDKWLKIRGNFKYDSIEVEPY